MPVETTMRRSSPHPFGACPLPQSRYDHDPARPRQRRPADRRADPAAVRAGLRQRRARARWRTRRPSARRRQRRDGAAARLHDRLVRRPAALLPGRRHRPAGGPRHGQRPGGRRRAAAVPVGGVHPRRRACRWPTCERIVALDARGVRRGRAWRWSPATPRSSTAARATGLHHHVRHRPGARRACAVDPRRPARRPHPRLGHDRRPRHRHHVGARGDRVRDRAGERHARR